MRQHHRPLQAAPTGANRHILQAARPLLGLDRENKNLRVLAFGDSITEGWIHSAWAKVRTTAMLSSLLAFAQCVSLMSPCYYFPDAMAVSLQVSGSTAVLNECNMQQAAPL